MKRLLALVVIAAALAGCSGQQLQPPTQPTPTSISASIADLNALPADPATIWADGDYAVRAACHAYLNTAAMKAAGMAQLGIGAGALGAGLSAINPLAGVASSLFQTALSGYGAAAALPYTTETATIIESAFDAYETTAPIANEHRSGDVDDRLPLVSVLAGWISDPRQQGDLDRNGGDDCDDVDLRSLPRRASGHRTRLPRNR